MRRSESILPLVLSGVIAVAIHAAVVPAVALYAAADGLLRALSRLDVPISPPAEEPETRKPPVGREDSRVSAVAWIAHDDFRELMAREGPTDQPALQQRVDPVEAAPPELDPTPPAPTPTPDPPSASQLASAMPQPPRPSPLPPSPLGQPQPWRLDPAGEVRVPFAPTPLVPETPRPEASSAQPSPASSDQPARPTAAPRSDREAPPSRVERFEWHRPGTVPVARGMEVQTFAPRFSVVAQYSIPMDPELILHFDGTGQAVRVELIRSSGFENVDGPIIAALYRWRASGERIEALPPGQTLEMPVTMHLRGTR